MFESIQSVQSAVETLAKFIDTHEDGATLSWVEIEKTTGQSMAVRGPGRGYFRRALRKLRRPYETLRAIGVRLSEPDSALTIVRGGIVRIDGAVRIAASTQAQLQARHLDQMTSEEQRKMLLAAGLFGAIRALASENRNKLFG